MSAAIASNRLATFLNILLKYRLVEPAKLEKLKGNPLLQGEDPRPLAKQLGQMGWLTKYQLKAIAGGNARELALGPYRILDCVGEGGMGQVFKAKHLAMNRIVALKIIRKELLVDEQQVKRFYQEVQAAAQLVHPHIMVAFDAGCEDDRHYLAMEFADGCDLSRLVEENGPLPVVQACEYIHQAALGLQYAHERGMVHRDIKPSNLFLAKPHQPAGTESSSGSTRMLMQKPLVKVLDLGLARFVDGGAEDLSLTKTGTVVGTPDYIAPEQAQNSRAVDIRSDLYSLGCAFYFLLAGRPPFEAKSAMDVMLLHYAEEPTPIEQWRPDVPRDVCAILRKLMAKRPDHRFQTPVELAVALEPFTGAVPVAPVLAVPPAVTESAAAAPAWRSPAPGRQSALDQTDLMSAAGLPAASASAAPSRRMAALLFLAPIVCALLFIGLWLIWDKEKPIGPLRSQPAPTEQLVQQPPAELPADLPAHPVARRNDPPKATVPKELSFQTAFQLRNIRTDSGRCKAGEMMTIRYELYNASAADVTVPQGRLGIRQHWLERMGPDPIIPNLGTSARIGNRYGAGGLPFRLDPVVLAGKAFPYERHISTQGFPPGRYRYHVEYKNDQDTVLHAVWVEFEVLPAGNGV